MQFCQLPANEPAARRFSQELWLPFHRALEEATETHELVDDIEQRLDEEVEFRLDLLDSESYEAVVAVDSEREEPSLTDPDVDLVGFITTDVEESPPVFDQPDRLKIGDFYVREQHRGTGLARELLDHAVERARETGCPELSLDVDDDNERARGFYENVGFETDRRALTAPVERVDRRGQD